MSKIKIQGNASGTGVVTLTAPNTNTDRTITLPDDTQTLIGTNASGNVGIGTASPSQEMHLYRSSGATDLLIEQASTGNAYIHTKNNNREYAIGTASDYLRFVDLTADVERLRITSDGRGLSQFTAKAWVNFNGTGTVAIRDSHNVSIITDNNTGDYTVNFTNALANADYSIAGAAGDVDYHVAHRNYSGGAGWSPTTTTCRIGVGSHTGTMPDSSVVNLLVFGD